MEFKFIFLDESFIDQNHHPNVSLMFYDETGCPVGVGKPAKGCRLCFIDAICDLGPVPGAWRVLKPRRRGAALEAAKRGSPQVCLVNSVVFLSSCHMFHSNGVQDYHDMFNGIFFKEWFMGVLNTLLEWQMDRKWVIVLGEGVADFVVLVRLHLCTYYSLFLLLAQIVRSTISWSQKMKPSAQAARGLPWSAG